MHKYKYTNTQILKDSLIPARSADCVSANMQIWVNGEVMDHRMMIVERYFQRVINITCQCVMDHRMMIVKIWFWWFQWIFSSTKKNQSFADLCVSKPGKVCEKWNLVEKGWWSGQFNSVHDVTLHFLPLWASPTRCCFTALVPYSRQENFYVSFFC